MKKRTLFWLILSFFLTPADCIIYAQTSSVQWAKCYGGSNIEHAQSVWQTTDGGYIVAGACRSTDGDLSGRHDTTSFDDMWVIKLTDTGSISWSKWLGGSSNDGGYATQQTADGGYIVAGYTVSNDRDVSGNHSHNADFWVVKLNVAGSISWHKCLGGTGADVANAIEQTTDGGYILAGYTNSNDGDVSGTHLDTSGYPSQDMWIVKLDDTGKVVWQKTLGGSSTDVAKAVRQTTDGGYIVAGYTYSSDGDVSGYHGGNGDGWVVKLNSSGSIQWDATFGGTGDDGFSSVQQTPDGGYIIAGTTNSNDGDISGNHLDTTGNPSDDAWLIKLYSNGHIDWQFCYGGSLEDEANDLKVTADSGFIMTGDTYSDDGDVSGNHSAPYSPDYWVAGISASGTLIWQKCLGGGQDDKAYSICTTSDNGYVAAGYTHSHDASIPDNHGAWDFWVVKLSYNAGVKNINKALQLLKVYPNPSSGHFIVTGLPLLANHPVPATIYNASGDKVCSFVIDDRHSSFDIRNQPSGVYFVHLVIDDQIIVRKVILRN